MLSIPHQAKPHAPFPARRPLFESATDAIMRAEMRVLFNRVEQAPAGTLQSLSRTVGGRTVTMTFMRGDGDRYACVITER